MICPQWKNASDIEAGNAHEVILEKMINTFQYPFLVLKSEFWKLISTGHQFG
jgi:hypothetical protein